MEERVSFPSGEYRLEGYYHPGSEKGAVITHPHPLYGGDMNNIVVETLVLAYQRKGYATLRFNFRGTGKIEGRHADGMGEREDVLAAVRLLAEKGVRQIDLAGYSFGAWVNAHIDCQSAGIRRMVMVSPPVNFLDFAAVGPIPCLRLVVLGDDDEFGNESRVRKMMTHWNPDARYAVLPDTDHFYSGALRDLEAALAENL
ncbi:alpha/beta hydrolase [Desulfococcus sp.]|uniref:alpha/beta hydrolase n=1 Tax=Desulfococcus sp. TaxID=2025834 RepID=UPI00359446EC